MIKRKIKTDPIWQNFGDEPGVKYVSIDGTTKRTPGHQRFDLGGLSQRTQYLLGCEPLKVHHVGQVPSIAELKMTPGIGDLAILEIVKWAATKHNRPLHVKTELNYPPAEVVNFLIKRLRYQRHPVLKFVLNELKLHKAGKLD